MRKNGRVSILKNSLSCGGSVVKMKQQRLFGVHLSFPFFFCRNALNERKADKTTVIVNEY